MATIEEWEQDEIRRSTVDATGRKQDLRANPANIQRYQNPPASTAYPLEYAFRCVGDIRGKRVLDFGCGAGENTILLAAKGADVIGMDISPELVELAKERLRLNGYPGTAVVDSCHGTKFADQSFDVIFGAAILHHLDLGLARAEVLRLLKKGGLAVFEEPIRDSRVLRLLRRAIPYRSPLASANERPLTTPELQSFATGFEVVEWRKFMLPHVTAIWAVFPSKLHQAFLLDRWLLKKLPWLHRWTGDLVIAMRRI